ncbi:hypothetical protein B0H16DRAFT_1687826 [Mycena metata]|uniref:Uncharacterized protein n=1 Tax=Mycena metata TaxID=1033252 RepID=A0AAD7NK47_9AGAR|nr:hypothetical protein B0H16DRAFT_1687826 [Mycena metata]
MQNWEQVAFEFGIQRGIPLMGHHHPGETAIHSSGLRTGHNVFRSTRPSGLMNDLIWGESINTFVMKASLFIRSHSQSSSERTSLTLICFTYLACFLATITAAYAGTIEMRQGCRGTKVCPTNTVLICCKGVNGPVDACFPPGVVC